MPTIDFTELNGREKARIATLLSKLPDARKLKGLRRTLEDYENLRSESGKQGVKLEDAVKDIEASQERFLKIVARTDRKIRELIVEREKLNTKVRDDFYKRRGNDILSASEKAELDDALRAASLQLASLAEREIGTRITPMNLERVAAGRREPTPEEANLLLDLESKTSTLRKKIGSIHNFHQLALTKITEVEEVLQEWVDGRYLELVNEGVVNADVSLTELLSSLRERKRDIIKRMNRSRVAQQELDALLRGFRSPKGSDPWTMEQYTIWSRNLLGVGTILAFIFSPLPVVSGVGAALTLLAQGVLYILEALGLRRGTA